MAAETVPEKEIPSCPEASIAHQAIETPAFSVETPVSPEPITTEPVVAVSVETPETVAASDETPAKNISETAKSKEFFPNLGMNDEDIFKDFKGMGIDFPNEEIALDPAMMAEVNELFEPKSDTPEEAPTTLLSQDSLTSMGFEVLPEMPKAVVAEEEKPEIEEAILEEIFIAPEKLAEESENQPLSDGIPMESATQEEALPEENVTAVSETVPSDAEKERVAIALSESRKGGLKSLVANKKLVRIFGAATTLAAMSAVSFLAFGTDFLGGSKASVPEIKTAAVVAPIQETTPSMPTETGSIVTAMPAETIVPPETKPAIRTPNIPRKRN